MAKNSAVNLDITNNADGFDASGGTTKRKATFTGADITFTGSGSNTYTFPASTCTLASANKTNSDVTASRAVNTTYTNSSSTNSILVMTTWRCAITLAGGNAYVQAKSDSSSPPTTVVSGIIGIQAGLLNEDNSFQAVFVVEPSKNYRVDSSATNGTVTLGKWIEVSF